MFGFIFNKERQLENLIYTYLEYLGKIQNHFVKAMNIYLKEGICDTRAARGHHAAAGKGR
jgi:hypothetical protein